MCLDYIGEDIDKQSLDTEIGGKRVACGGCVLPSATLSKYIPTKRLLLASSSHTYELRRPNQHIELPDLPESSPHVPRTKEELAEKSHTEARQFFDMRRDIKHRMSADAIDLLRFFNENIFDGRLPIRPGFVKWHCIPNRGRRQRIAGHCEISEGPQGVYRVHGIVIHPRVASHSEMFCTLLHECVHAYLYAIGEMAGEPAHGQKFHNVVNGCVQKLHKTTLPSIFAACRTVTTNDVL